MSDQTPLTPQDFDVWKLASPTHLLALLRKLEVDGRVIATWLGITPSLVSQWYTSKRPIHPRYAPALRMRARETLEQASQRNDKEAAAQPTTALQDATRAEFDAIYNRWKQQVLFDGGTLLKQLHQQYYALGGWILKERYNAEDVASVRLVTEAMVQQMERLRRLQGTDADAEADLYARLSKAREAPHRTRDDEQPQT
jgi:hypothetical protein